ncbi:DNA polymerase III subunit alpha [Mogibacterium neglectum]|uniref:DNA polymerase III subunit alpha n=1 Tax=Mogibacterium neglectum TaxID=114528 RepID=UPI00272ADFB4|nr:DNA polymerase III subunit alpha [Mogibacterium neglectum]WLD75847.1 DNA polymerase III subunit alpha [Mogibacterium neglectum]
MAFTHLHVHSEYSLLDGMSKINKAPEYVKSLGMDSLAITDHGVMFGIIDFYKSCKKSGIKPIIGCEVYVAPRTRFDKDPDRDRNMNHLVLLAENMTGYKNLTKLVSAAFTEGFYFKPRVDKELLREHSEGIICLSACLAGAIPRKILNGDYSGAKVEALELRDIFGIDNFYLEVQNHFLDDDKPAIEGLVKLAEEIGAPLVATNDAHYIKRGDAKAHDVLLAIQTGSTVDDENRMRFANDEFYLKSEAEMLELFPSHPEAIENSHKIAERCNVGFEFGEYHLPEFIPPEDMTNKDYLRKLCYEGLERRYGSEANEQSSIYRDRLESELEVIEKMGYVEYFLIVWDFIHYAKSNDIPVGPGRGSAAGSIVAYSLAITEIEPIKYNLIFERFLNPERVSMPDIDVDFCIDRRQEVIDYVVRKYGKDKVSQIITFGTLKAKAAVRDVGRALNASYAEADSIAKAIPAELGMTISKALDINRDLRARYETEPLVKNILDMSMAVEGMPRHSSTHAAGIVISKMPLDEYVPLYMSDKGLATQFNMTTIEELGLLKMDFLGLRNLTMINEAIQLIKENHGVEIDFSKMDYDDPSVYDMISKGNTQGIFQLESAGMTEFMKTLNPSCFEDIVAGISLYRPGPMDSIPKYIENKKNPEKVKYVDPHLEPILNVTYGCMVYQEQVMQIVRELGGYSFGRSDLVRRAMSKKKMSVMLEEKKYFIHGKDDSDGTPAIAGCVANGIPERAAEAIFDDMVSFAEYAFNKSHAAAYAVVSYETAYLKAHYPVEFMAALMSSVMGEPRHIAAYIRNCKELGIEVLPPSVLHSRRKFIAKDGKIRFGLLAIKNVGSGIVDAIVEGRRGRDINNLYDFIKSIEPSELNKKAIECLIKAGAMDEFTPNRAALLAISDDAVGAAQRSARKVSKDQISLFQLDSDLMEDVKTAPELPNIKNFDKAHLLAMEKEMMGVYLSGHPLDKYRDLIDENITANTAEIFDLDLSGDSENESNFIGKGSSGRNHFNDGDTVIMAGMVGDLRRMITKSNQEMARLTIEDYFGVITAIVFPRDYAKAKYVLENDAIVAVKGTLSFKEDSDPEILVNKVTEIERISEFKSQSGNDYDRASISNYSHSKIKTEPLREKQYLKLRVSQELSDLLGNDEIQQRILGAVSAHSGDIDVLIYLPGQKPLKSANGVNIDENLLIELEQLLGKENVKH